MWGSKALSFADIITLLFTVLAAWLYSEFGALKIKLKNEKGDSQFFPWYEEVSIVVWSTYFVWNNLLNVKWFFIKLISCCDIADNSYSKVLQSIKGYFKKVSTHSNICNMLGWWVMGRLPQQRSIWCFKSYFFRNLLQNSLKKSFQFIILFTAKRKLHCKCLQGFMGGL